MFFSKATALAVIAALPIVLATPILDTRQNGVTCQTSSGSPLTDDVTAVINELNGRGGSCPQTNDKASDCTTLAKSGDAAVSICGIKDTDSSAISCSDVAGYANQIQQTCLNGDPGNPKTLTGGTYTVSPSKRVEVINTKSV
ncbi:MAG: hypothetical protein Q9161_005085 [Pseudevernia consocians]